MKNLNTLLNMWDFENGPYEKEFSFNRLDIIDLAYKYPKCSIKLTFNRLFSHFDRSNYSSKKNYKIELYSKSIPDRVFEITSSNPVLPLHLFKNKDVVIKVNVNPNTKTYGDVLGISHLSENEKKIIQTVYDFTLECLVSGSAEGGTSHKYLLYDFKSSRVFRLDANKIVYPKILPALKTTHPEISNFLTNQEVYPILDLYIEKRIKEDYLKHFEIIHKDES